MTTTVYGEPANGRISRHLVQALGRGKYDRWFGSARLNIRDGQLEVAVPNRFVADWIDNHFHDELLGVAEHELGEGAAVQLRIQPAPQAAKSRPAQPSSPPARAVKPAGRAAPDRGGPVELVTRAGVLRHDLADFVVGPSNELAYSAACRLASEPDCRIKPLFIHGGCGLGKTHLLQGLCRRFAELNPSAQWCYVTAEQFTNGFVHAVRRHRLEGFRRRLRRLDLLVVDDVHFLANKSATQNEFLHTFDANDLYGAKVVLASDAHPKQIRELADALVSRFMSGMVVAVAEPDTATRLRIIQALARRRGLALLEGAAERLSRQCGGSVREIEGLLTKLSALAALRSEGDGGRGPIGHALVDQLLGADAARAQHRPVRLEQIVDCVCREMRVERAQLMTRCRHRRIVLARSAAIYLARQMTTLSYPELARAMGRPNHSTIVTAAQRVARQVRQRCPTLLLDTSLPDQMDLLVEHLRRGVLEAPAVSGDRGR